uniref:C2h2-type zn-finger protein n=1 Tax=Lutzomyia longipalpis TaxID=7200 RepID=A0A1B0GLQ0_LUTLO
MSENQAYCRLCLRANGFLVSIFEDKDDKYDQLIEEYTSVLIRENEENLPVTVCTGCLRYIESFRSFKLQCIKNDELLRKGILGQPVKEEFDDIPNIAADVTFASNSPEPEGPPDSPGYAESLPDAVKLEKDRVKKVKQEEAEPTDGETKKKKKQQNRTLKVCYICGKTTTNQTLHLIRHSDMTPYKCDYPDCTKSYKTYLGLRYHKYTHTDYRPHVCEICGRGFARRSKMVVHMLVHTNERNFPCELCGKAFKQRYNLIAHRRTHTDDRRKNVLIVESAS